jgi:trans-aconitate methyltransferase
MLGKHIFDPEFLYSSKELKKVLTSFEIQFEQCLDIPCGTGRNIFLLASYFKYVTGADISQSYLDSINTSLPEYQIRSSINTERIDLLHEIPRAINNATFIANIHYYNHSLSARLTGNMKKGAFLYIETPGCAGQNYKELPTEQEIESLFKEMDVLFYKKNCCKPEDIYINNIAFKALLRKK